LVVLGRLGLDGPILEAGGIEREWRVVGRLRFPVAIGRGHLPDDVIHGGLAVRHSLTTTGTSVAGIEGKFGQVSNSLARLEKAAHVVPSIRELHKFVAHLGPTARAPSFGARTVLFGRILAVVAERALHGLLEMVFVLFGRSLSAQPLHGLADFFLAIFLQVRTAFAYPLRLADRLLLLARLAYLGRLQDGLHGLVPDLLVWVVHGGHERRHDLGVLRGTPDAGQVSEGSLLLGDFVLGCLGLGGRLDRRIGGLLSRGVQGERIWHSQKAPDRQGSGGRLGLGCRPEGPAD
jgi:hypothetical protein